MGMPDDAIRRNPNFMDSNIDKFTSGMWHAPNMAETSALVNESINDSLKQ